MRDERWVNRFHYAWNDTLFFDPLDVYYEPRKDHFLSDLDEEVKSRFVRSGIWWSYRHNPNLPTQGWKIHVSATHRNVRAVANAVINYLVTHHIDFKIALDMNIFEMLNSKAMSRGSGGKLITIYPENDDEFRSCIADLAQILDGAEGAYVLSDMRYRDCKSLYFRYGQFINTSTVDVLGRKVPHIIGPDGPIPDDRKPHYSQPWWLPWPFTDWKPNDDSDEEELLGGRFRVTEALQFSNSGGVYKAEDTANNNQLVVIKEARPHTNFNPRKDHDATDILAREWEFLNILGDVESFPAPIAKFRHWEHHFIAEEFVDRSDIRSVLLEHNPLAQPGADSQEFLRIFLTVFRGLVRAVQAAHQRGVILGDLTAANILIDSDSFEITIIDLEACRLAETEQENHHLQETVELYTPGFSHSRRADGASDFAGDLYSIATIMSYFIFPIAAMSYLREDVFELYRYFIDALGWPVQIHEVIKDLAQARISLEDVLEFLADDTALIAQVQEPSREPVVEEQLKLPEVKTGVALFMKTVADLDRETLFPVDPFAYVTNPLSLGFGASGVLWALERSGFSLRPEWREWLEKQVTDLDIDEYPNGLMSGLAGIAWALDDLGLHAPARDLLDQANRRMSDINDYTFYYGLAGLGMANLRFHLRERRQDDLEAAKECARILRDTVQRDGPHVYWLNEFAKDGPLTGLGFGQSGVAMFLLRMYQITQDSSYLQLGRDALAWEMANSESLSNGAIMFRHGNTLEPYVEVGSAGVAKVLLRYGDLDSARALLRGLDIDYSVLPGYSFGMAGVADTMLDAAAILGDSSYRDIALKQLDYLRRIYLFEPAKRFAIPRQDGTTPLAVPGEGLLRCACDLLTGSAGVLRVLHRAHVGGTADFLLDEVAR
ncbi:MAG TPA: class III lanthionine synthetase LanKC [Natronosporangium sp.]|nr:class III lanthionine synthetase LanKC [Natronosporangium sp.]